MQVEGNGNGDGNRPDGHGGGSTGRTVDEFIDASGSLSRRR
jgi:hypothetical protein